MNPDEAIHFEEVQEVKQAIEERIEQIETDPRYDGGENPADSADVRTNGVLAIMQTEWSGEVSGLTFAYNLLEDLA